MSSEPFVLTLLSLLLHERLNVSSTFVAYAAPNKYEASLGPVFSIIPVITL
jgi:hypothetical protein